MTTQARSQQSLIDIAVQEYGSVEGLVDLAMRNGKSINDLLTIGENLQFGQVTNADIVKFLADRKIKVATGAEEFVPLIGVPYVVGNGLESDGLNDYVSLPAVVNAGIINSFQIIFKLKSYSNIGSVLLNSGISSRHMFLYANGLIGINYSGVSGVVSQILNLNQIYKLTITRNINTHKIYLNGVFLSNVTINTSLDSLFKIFFADLGQSLFSSNIIYDLKIFDKELTQAEVNVLELLNVPFSALSNLIFDMRFESLNKVGIDVFTPALVGSQGQLIGYATGAKGIVDINNNDIQLVP